MRYYDYDAPAAPDPYEMEAQRRHARRVARNNMLDCRDPDHDDRLCPYCNGDDEGGDDE